MSYYYLNTDEAWNDTIQAVEYDLFKACGDDWRTLKLKFGDYIYDRKVRFVYDTFYKNLRESKYEAKYQFVSWFTFHFDYRKCQLQVW